MYKHKFTRKERQMLGLNANAGRRSLLDTDGIGPRSRDGARLNNGSTGNSGQPAATAAGSKTPGRRNTVPGPAPELPPRDEAFQTARIALAEDHGSLARLEQAALLLEIDAVQPTDPGQYLVADRFHVGRHCDCIDHAQHGVDWCTHRLAVALYLKALQIEAARATAAPDTPSRIVIPKVEDRPNCTECRARSCQTSMCDWHDPRLIL